MYWFARRYYARLVRRFGPREGALLEIGCGLGDLLALLEPYYECTGLDVSAYAIEQCRRRAPASTLLQGSADGLSAFPDGRFAVVVSLHVFEHLEQPAETIRQARRILQPGGLLLFATPDPDYRLRRFKDRETDAIGKDPTHINVQPADVWRGWRQEAGLDIVRHFSDGPWDTPYLPLIPKTLQFAVFGLPSLAQVLTGTTLVPLGFGVNQVLIARAPR